MGGNRVETGNPLRMIVVGSGRGKSHARSFLARPDRFELVGLVDIDEPRLKAAISDLELPGPSCLHSHTRTALEGSDCDGVVVATWARTHDELVEAAIEADKHVMVEKPFTLELAPAKRPHRDRGGAWAKNRCNAAVAVLARTAHSTTFDDRGVLMVSRRPDTCSPTKPVVASIPTPSTRNSGR